LAIAFEHLPLLLSFVCLGRVAAVIDGQEPQEVGSLLVELARQAVEPLAEVDDQLGVF
jgi:hypothetical protein